MPRVFEEVRALQGKTLKTLKLQRPFTVVEVTPDIVRVVPLEGKNLPRRIELGKIEAIAGMGFNRDELRQRVHEEFESSRNTSYIAAIVHEITKSGN